MAAVAEQTRLREIVNENGERIIIAENNKVVTVELEPGVYATRVQKQTAVIGIAASSNNAVAPAPSRPAITYNREPSYDSYDNRYSTRERTCCESAWHCDDGAWYSPCGKGPAWIPFYILMWLICIALFVCLFLFGGICILLVCCKASDDW